MNNRKKIVALAAFVFCPAIGGCTIFPRQTTPPIKTYVLAFEPPSDGRWPQCTSRDGALQVSRPLEKAGLNTAGIAYLLRPQEVRYYAYNKWADSPGRLLIPLLVEGMDKTDCWSSVAQSGTPVRGEYRLDTEIIHWEQEFFSTPSRVRLSIRAQLVESEGRTVIAAQRFDLLKTAPSNDAYGAATAINDVVNQFVRDVATWVKNHAPPA